MAWVKGQSGNPKGRPAGAKDAFTRKFWCDMHHAWKEHGIDAIERTIKNYPERFLSICATLVPKEDQRSEVRHSIEVTLRSPDWLEGLRDITPAIPNNHNGNSLENTPINKAMNGENTPRRALEISPVKNNQQGK